jgi:hypothetical protein
MRINSMIDRSRNKISNARVTNPESSGVVQKIKNITLIDSKKKTVNLVIFWLTGVVIELYEL